MPNPLCDYNGHELQCPEICVFPFDQQSVCIMFVMLCEQKQAQKLCSTAEQQVLCKMPGVVAL